jgi:hypothetical protein
MADSVQQSQKRSIARTAAIVLFGEAHGIRGMKAFLLVLTGISQIAIWVGVLLSFAAPWLLAGWWEEIVKVTDNPVTRVFAVLLLLLVMYLCYRARKYHQRAFGITEILLGLAGCWAGLDKKPEEAFAGSLAVVAGIYLGVRGITNISEGRAGDAAPVSSNQGSLTNFPMIEDCAPLPTGVQKTPEPLTEYVQTHRSEPIPLSLLTGKPADLGLILKSRQLFQSTQGRSFGLKSAPPYVPLIPPSTDLKIPPNDKSPAE